MFAAKNRDDSPASSARSYQEDGGAKNPQATRETIESIVVAVILAFLFRAFIAEAFVIPTGSMAPTLQGRHMDVKCTQCAYRYRTGASSENPDSPHPREITHTTCPLCRFETVLQKDTDANQKSFNGDRILVSKFAYLLGDPDRWDVIVFKFPGNAKQNYIKRLIGLPGETLRIRHGDISVRNHADGDAPFRIARKPPDKVKAMLQLVHDSDYLGGELKRVGWPSRWQSTRPASGGAGWQAGDEGRGFAIDVGQDRSWLRYHHIVPWPDAWRAIDRGERPSRLDEFSGQLITDYYEYNDYIPTGLSDSRGTCWVGDLAIECEVEVESDAGQLTLDLVEGGAHYRCQFDLSSGQAELSIDDGHRLFADEEGNRVERPTAETTLNRPGRYRLRYANVDDQLLLWVNNRLVAFEGPTTYEPPADVRPHWSPEDPGDLAPAGIGSQEAKLYVERLRVLRDVYYLAVESDNRDSEYDEPASPYRIQQIIADPTQWATTSLFASRRSVEFSLQEDQFFPMGDNSPQSKDARLWSYGRRETGYHDPEPFVERDLLIGKALLIYWPHAWRGPFGLPLVPNFTRMGLIR